MLISAKLRYTNGGKVWFSNVMLLYICNNFDNFVADFREVVGGLIDPPQYLYSQPIKSVYLVLWYHPSSVQAIFSATWYPKLLCFKI